MFAPKCGRWKRFAALVTVGSVMALALACASQPEPGTAPDESVLAGSLTDVAVESGDGGTIVTLYGRWRA